jgi:hypothetical protein
MSLKDEFLQLCDPSANEMLYDDLKMSRPLVLRRMSSRLTSEYDLFKNTENRTVQQYQDLKWQVFRQCVLNEDRLPFFKPDEREKFDSWPSNIVDKVFLAVAAFTGEEPSSEEMAKN